MLFFQGTRDSLCHLDTFQPLLETLSPKPVLHIIEGADHSFKLLKRIERSRQSVLQEVIQVSAEWISQRS
jgi:predicted alpha/beta-hydrolase family hydrolase